MVELICTNGRKVSSLLVIYLVEAWSFDSIILTKVRRVCQLGIKVFLVLGALKSIVYEFLIFIVIYVCKRKVIINVLVPERSTLVDVDAVGASLRLLVKEMVVVILLHYWIADWWSIEAIVWIIVFIVQKVVIRISCPTFILAKDLLILWVFNNSLAFLICIQ